MNVDGERVKAVCVVFQKGGSPFTTRGSALTGSVFTRKFVAQRGQRSIWGKALYEISQILAEAKIQLLT